MLSAYFEMIEEKYIYSHDSKITAGKHNTKNSKVTDKAIIKSKWCV